MDYDSEDSDSYIDNQHQDIQDELNDMENKIDKENEISTEGITQEELGNVNKTKGLKRCLCCGKYYKATMVIYDQTGIEQCLHCLFWMNYDEKTRLEFDKTCSHQGIGIANYILECHEDHDAMTCVRGSVGCFLCDYKLKNPIINIMNHDMLGIETQSKTENDTKKCNEENKENDVIFVSYSGDACLPIKIPKKLTI